MDLAEDRFSDYDKPLFPAEQTEVAKLLLELRVTFRENQKLSHLYRADIKLSHQRVALVLEDPGSQGHEDRFIGLEQLKSQWLSEQDPDEGGCDVKTINVQDWKKLDRIGKLRLLAEITMTQVKMKNEI